MTILNNILKIRRFERLIFVVVLLFVSTHIRSQSPSVLDKTITVSVSDVPTEVMLKHLGQKCGVIFSYSNKIFRTNHVRFSRKEATLREFLDEMFLRYPVEYIVKDSKIILNPTISEPRYIISGYCKDSISGEVLIGSTIYEVSALRGASTNDYGYYSFSLPQGNVDIRCSFVGYGNVLSSFNLNCDTVLNFNLKSTLKLDEIDVFPINRSSDVEMSRTGTVSLPVEQIKSVPALLGESDIIKSLQLMPGVQSGQEGFGGFNVRGGGADQNVVFMDDVPLYNSHHLLGLFSVFNSESINNVTLVKSGFPARYGGRLSSVLDVKMREGNTSGYHGAANVGLLASGAVFEGPIIRGRSSFIISARRTYFDLFSSPIQLSQDRRMSYYFYDISAKLNYILSKRDRLYASFFAGYDKYGVDYNNRTTTINYGDVDEKDITISDGIGTKWGNIVTSVRWNHLYGPRLFSNTILYFSKFKFNVKQKQNNCAENVYDTFTHDYFSGIRDFGLRTDYVLYPSKNFGVCRFGANATLHTFFPGVNIMRESNSVASVDTTYGNMEFYRTEFHLYAEDDQPIGKKMKISAGLHLSGLNRSGHKVYLNLEPRLLFMYLPSKKSSLKLGYSEMTQYLHLVRIASVASPADLWLPIMDNIDPLYSKQLTFESDFGLWENFGVTVEVYKKWLENILTYKNISGELLTISNDWSYNLVSGNGKSYGIEAFLHKKAGRLSGWIGYSWSKSKNRFSDLNKGKSFPSDNDRTHSASLFALYRINPQVDLALSWTFGTGNPVSLPDTKYYVPQLPTSSSSSSTTSQLVQSRNTYRMPDSHKLNIGVNFRKELSWGSRTFSVGVYNVYARKNPLFVYLSNTKDDDGNTVSKLKQYSLIAWPWPYFKYVITF